MNIREEIKHAVDEIAEITMEREGVYVVSHSEPQWKPDGDEEVIAVIEELFFSYSTELQKRIKELKVDEDPESIGGAIRLNSEEVYGLTVHDKKYRNIILDDVLALLKEEQGERT